MLFAPRYFRLLLSYTVAAAAAATCAVLNHVHVAWRQPATWSNVLDHRCGRFMLACAAWALAEMMLALALPRERDSRARRSLIA